MSSTTKVFVLGRFVRRICEGKITQAMALGGRLVPPSPGKRFALQHATASGRREVFARGLCATSESVLVNVNSQDGDYVEFGTYMRVSAGTPGNALERFATDLGFNSWSEFKIFNLKAGRPFFGGYIIRWDGLTFPNENGAAA